MCQAPGQAFDMKYSIFLNNNQLWWISSLFYRQGNWSFARFKSGGFLSNNKYRDSRAQWETPDILAPGRLRQADRKFEASQGYTARPCLNNWKSVQKYKSGFFFPRKKIDTLFYLSESIWASVTKCHKLRDLLKTIYLSHL